MGAPAYGDLVFARQVREGQVAYEPFVHRQQSLRRVENLRRIYSREGATEDIARSVPTCFGRREAGLLEQRPDLRHVFDANPVQLDVLTVGDVGDVAAEVLGDGADDICLARSEQAARDSDAKHEVAVDLGTLGVKTVPAEPVPQVRRPDRREALFRVDVLDTSPDLEAIVLALRDLGRVEGLEISQGPLPFRPEGGRAGRGLRGAFVPGRLTGQRSASFLGWAGLGEEPSRTN